MTEHQNDNKDSPRLEALYREAGDIEPDAGLERVIRARADEAVRLGRSASRRPWLGGLVTASVAIVAIAVVLQQTPPHEPGTESRSVPKTPSVTAGDADAFMSPSIGADATLEESTGAQRRARREIREMQSTSTSDLVEPPASPAPSVEQSRAGNRSPESVQAQAREQESVVANRNGIAAEPTQSESEEVADDSGAMLKRIKALIENDDIERARGLLETFMRKYPDQTVPEEIREALAPAG